MSAIRDIIIALRGYRPPEISASARSNIQSAIYESMEKFKREVHYLTDKEIITYLKDLSDKANIAVTYRDPEEKWIHNLDITMLVRQAYEKINENLSTTEIGEILKIVKSQAVIIDGLKSTIEQLKATTEMNHKYTVGLFDKVNVLAEAVDVRLFDPPK